MYDYVRKTYGVHPIPGQRVTHTETGKCGVIVREKKSAVHYVHVRFDGYKFLCDVSSLDRVTGNQRSHFLFVNNFNGRVC